MAGCVLTIHFMRIGAFLPSSSRDCIKICGITPDSNLTVLFSLLKQLKHFWFLKLWNIKFCKTSKMGKPHCWVSSVLSKLSELGTFKNNKGWTKCCEPKRYKMQQENTEKQKTNKKQNKRKVKTQSHLNTAANGWINWVFNIHKGQRLSLSVWVLQLSALNRVEGARQCSVQRH